MTSTGPGVLFWADGRCFCLLDFLVILTCRFPSCIPMYSVDLIKTHDRSLFGKFETWQLENINTEDKLEEDQ